ncbi:histidine kinase N-terminal 7TM domain-containing protein [Thermodesulfobacteriota bacterium]
MNIFSLSGLSVGLSCLFVSTITILYGKTKLHRLLLLFNLVVAIWGVGVFLVGMAGSETEAVTAWKIALLGGWLISPTFLHMMSVFCGIERRKTVLFAYTQGIFFVLLHLLTDLVINDVRFVFDIYFVDAGILFTIAIFFYAFFAILAFYSLIKFLGTTSGHKRIQTLYNIFGFMIGFLGGTSTLPPMFHIDILIPFGNFGITLYVCILTYAIFRHQLMDLPLAVKRTLTYSLSAGLASGLFIVIVLFLTKYFSALFGIDSFSISIIAAIIIAILFHPIHTTVQKFLDRVFYKSKYDYTSFIKDTSATLSNTTNADDIRIYVLDTIFSILKLKNAVLLTRTANNYIPFISRVYKEETKVEFSFDDIHLEVNSEFIREISRVRAPFNYETLPVTVNVTATDSAKNHRRRLLCPSMLIMN